MTVSDLSLQTSWLTIRTGRTPDCSLPRVGFRSAHQMSPLGTRATSLTPHSFLLQRMPVPPQDQASSIRKPGACDSAAKAAPAVPPEKLCSDWERPAAQRGDRAERAAPYQWLLPP